MSSSRTCIAVADRRAPGCLTHAAIRIGLAIALLSLPARAQEPSLSAQTEARPPPIGGSRVTGQVKERYATLLVIVLRNGFTVRVDLTRAIQNNTAVVANPGMFVQVDGVLTNTGMMAAYVLRRAKPTSASWSPDLG